MLDVNVRETALSTGVEFVGRSVFLSFVDCIKFGIFIKNEGVLGIISIQHSNLNVKQAKLRAFHLPQVFFFFFMKFRDQ